MLNKQRHSIFRQNSDWRLDCAQNEGIRYDFYVIQKGIWERRESGGPNETDLQWKKSRKRLDNFEIS